MQKGVSETRHSREFGRTIQTLCVNRVMTGAEGEPEDEEDFVLSVKICHRPHYNWKREEHSFCVRLYAARYT